MQIKALNILFVCMLSYFKCISIILFNLSYDIKYIILGIILHNSKNIILFSFVFEIIIIFSWFNDKKKYFYLHS